MRLSTRFPLILFLLFVLAGCDSGAVVFAPTPLPPDLSPVTVRHPSGAFSVAVPPNWGTYIQDSGTVVSLSFSPPGYDTPALIAAVIQLAGDTPDTRQVVADYQTLHRPDLRRYTETARDNLPDGSWRFGGVRTLSDGTQLPLNTFIRIDGSFVSVVETIVPDDETLRGELERAVNTMSIDPTASLPPAELSALSFVHTSSLEVQNTSLITTGGAPSLAASASSAVVSGRPRLTRAPVAAKKPPLTNATAIEGASVSDCTRTVVALVRTASTCSPVAPSCNRRNSG